MHSELPSALKFRLLTEAEWEFAARGGNKSKGYKYSGSNDYEEVSWNGQNSDGKTHPVKQKRANELGIYDMSGNVWEWCKDYHCPYEIRPQTNPLCSTPSYVESHVNRGGSWRSGIKHCRVSSRNSGVFPGAYRIGCRLAM